MLKYVVKMLKSFTKFDVLMMLTLLASRQRGEHDNVIIQVCLLHYTTP